MIFRLLIILFALALLALAAWRVMRILDGPAPRRRLPRENREDEIEDATFSEVPGDGGKTSARRKDDGKR